MKGTLQRLQTWNEIWRMTSPCFIVRSVCDLLASAANGEMGENRRRFLSPMLKRRTMEIETQKWEKCHNQHKETNVAPCPTTAPRVSQRYLAWITARK